MSVLDRVLEESKTTFRSILQKPNDMHLKILNILKESGKVDKTLGENIFVNNHSLPLTIDYSDKTLEFIEYSGGLRASVKTDDFTYSLADIYKRAIDGDYSPYNFLSRYDLDYLVYVIALCAYENDAVNNLLLMFRKKNVPNVEKFEEMFKIIKAGLTIHENKLLTYEDDNWSGVVKRYSLDDKIEDAVNEFIDDDSPESCGGWVKQYLIANVKDSYEVFNVSTIADLNCVGKGQIKEKDGIWLVEFDKDLFLSDVHWLMFYPVERRDYVYKLNVSIVSADLKSEKSSKNFREEVFRLFETGVFYGEHFDLNKCIKDYFKN